MKIIKIILLAAACLLILLIASCVITYKIDKSRIIRNECPIFCMHISFLDATDADSSTYSGLGYYVRDYHYFDEQEEGTVRHWLEIKNFFSGNYIETPQKIITREQFNDSHCF